MGTRKTTYLELRINGFPSTSLNFQRYKGQNHLWTRIKRITNRTRYRVVIPDITWKHFVFNTTSFIIISNNQVFGGGGYITTTRLDRKLQRFPFGFAAVFEGGRGGSVIRQEHEEDWKGEDIGLCNRLSSRRCILLLILFDEYAQ